MTAYTLGSGNDNITGTNSRDQINGTTATWQAADVIDGAAGNDILQVSVLSAAAATVSDAVFQHITSVETLALTGKFAETVTLGTLSESAGLIELDGIGITGNLTVDASGRSSAIAIDAATGANTLTGTIDDDIFRFTSSGLSATDKVNGGGFGDSDTIQITDKAALTDAAFAHVTHVERVSFGSTLLAPTPDATGQKITLGALSMAAGVTEVDVLNDQGATLDAGARTLGIAFHGGNGDDVLKASQGNDTFLGGGGFDSFQAKEAQFTAADTIDGGTGRDEIRLTDATQTVADAAFSGVHGVESLVFAAAGKQTVALGALAAQSGLDTIDATKVSGGLKLTLDAGMTNALEIELGTGADTLNLGDGSRHTVVMKSTSLTAADHIIGNSNGDDFLQFSDAVKLTDKSFANASGVDNFGFLVLDSAAKGQSLVAGDAFSKFVAADGLTEILANGAAADTSITFDFTKYTGPATMVVNGSGGGDVFLAGAVNVTFLGSATETDQGVADSFRYHSADFSAADTVFGGKSLADELVILDAGTHVLDTAFTNTHSVEVLKLGATKTGDYEVQLAAHAHTAGIATVDASAAGVNVTLDAHTLTTGVTLVAGAKDNTFAGGSGDDVVSFDAKTFNNLDFVNGSTSTNGDTLKFSTAGVISEAALAHVQNIEFIQLSDKGNTLTLADNVVATAESISYKIAGFDLGDDLYVETGKGKDTVDLSKLTTNADIGIFVTAGDKYIGSKGDDHFIIHQSSDLSSATVIQGGGGSNQLILGGGTYTAAQFKGVSGVAGMFLLDDNTAANYSITLDNTAFKNAVGHSLGVDLGNAMTGNVDIDASSVTDPLARLSVEAGTGNDIYKGTAGDDFFRFDLDNSGHSELNALDILAAGGGHDLVQIGSGSFSGTAALTDSDLSHVSGLETLVLFGPSTEWDFVMDAAFQAAGVTELDLTGTGDTYHINAAAYTADLLIEVGETGGAISTGSGNDQIEFLDGTFSNAKLTSAYTLDGGAGHDALLFVGAASVADADFSGVHHIEEIDVQQSVFSVTLGANTDNAGIVKVDASAADAGAFINGASSTHALTLIGSSAGDIIAGGSGSDHLIGGHGNDVLVGNGGADVFEFHSAADSHLAAGNNLNFMDIIGDLSAGDEISIDALVGSVNGVTNKGTVGSFTADDTAGFFGGNDVAVQFDGTNSRVYVDANHDGNFNVNQDVVIQVLGNHVSQLTDTATYA